MEMNGHMIFFMPPNIYLQKIYAPLGYFNFAFFHGSLQLWLF